MMLVGHACAHASVCQVSNVPGGCLILFKVHNDFYYSSYHNLQSTPKFSELTMPVEDSQDLFRDESPLPSLGINDSQRTGESQSFHFSFEEDETQSQFLDENG